MRAKTGLGIGLAVLGLLSLAAAAILAWVVVPDRKELPADTNTVRQFDGTARVLLNPQALAGGDLRNALRANVPVTAERTVKVLATDGDAAQVSDERTLLAGGQPAGQTSATYAVDRTSLEATTSIPSDWDVTPHQGLTVSFPIGAKQQDYTGWVSDTQSTAPVTYEREENKGGVNTYVYTSTVSAAPITGPGGTGEPATGAAADRPRRIVRRAAAHRPAEGRPGAGTTAPGQPGAVELHVRGEFHLLGRAHDRDRGGCGTAGDP